jgi:hypothetical protein
MTVEMIRRVLLWCTILNFGVLWLWFVLYALARPWFYRLWGRRFRISEEHFDIMNVAGMSLYKLGILLLNAIPFIALVIAS